MPPADEPRSASDRSAGCLLAQARQVVRGVLVSLAAAALLASGCTVGLDPSESQRPAPPADARSFAAGPPDAADDRPAVTVGAEVLAASGFEILRGHRIGLIANQTSMVGDRHLIDVLLNLSR